MGSLHGTSGLTEFVTLEGHCSKAWVHARLSVVALRLRGGGAPRSQKVGRRVLDGHEAGVYINQGILLTYMRYLFIYLF